MILVQGLTGPDVRKLQNFLNRSFPTNLPRLKEDGIFGSKTKARVVEFQTMQGLKADGMVGPKTEEMLILCADEISTAKTEAVIAEWYAQRAIRELRADIRVA